MTREKRPGPATRRFGYMVSALVNAALLVLVNVWPGWETVPFLTDDTAAVVGIVNASILAGIAVNLALLVADPGWFKALGDLVTTGVGLAAVVRVWQVFPFDFGSSPVPWDTVTRVFLVIGIVGSTIGLVVAFVRLVTSVVQIDASSIGVDSAEADHEAADHEADHQPSAH
jgi:hypothetical protein